MIVGNGKAGRSPSNRESPVGSRWSNVFGNVVLPIGFVVWLAFLLVGTGLLTDYSARPGDTGRVPPVWPDGSAIAKHELGHHVLLFLHPRCPCSLATVDGFAKVRDARTENDHCTLVLAHPEGTDDGWVDTVLVQRARAMVDHVVDDLMAVESHRFGVRTSGQVLIYDANGRLRYSGAITAGRGHAGDNAGLTSALAVLRSDPTTGYETEEGGCHPAFGCRLQLDSEKANP